MPSLNSFAMTKVLFAATGTCFALIKVSVYATIGIITKDKKDHASFMNFIESFFMVGILTGYFIFSAFILLSHWLIDATNLAHRWAHFFRQSELHFVQIMVDQTMHIVILACLTQFLL